MNYMHVHLMITSHSIALPSIRVLCIALRCVALRCVALRCIALHCIALHCIAYIHTCNALHIALHIALHCIALHWIALHCIALHCIALHCIAHTSIPFHSMLCHSILFHLFHLFNFLHLSSFVYAMTHLFATRRPQVATVSHEVQTQAGGACCLEAVTWNRFRWFQTSDGKHVFFNRENGSIVFFIGKMDQPMYLKWGLSGR